ncbi:MAG: transposase [Nostocaceae cyanobacterium]|nr:transposase [Nostocaceae cyanobacterium]
MRKLTDSDKQEILKLYRESAQTTSTLAERYGVSNSTISRLLKSTLPEDEYDYLVSLKRAARTPEGRAQVNYDNLPLFVQQEPKNVEKQQQESEKIEEKPLQIASADEVDAASRRVRKRSSAAKKPPQPVTKQLELLAEKPEEEEQESIDTSVWQDSDLDARVLAELLGEELSDESEELEDLEDLDEDYEEEEEEEQEQEFVKPLVKKSRKSTNLLLQALPLSAANLPKTCYLVIDRASELITRPLQEFGDLGEISNLETQEQTLPVFDNHRVAKRFSTKRDRVIKVPDSRIIHKARRHLEAKGITRLLIDGQIYSLSPV